MPSDAGNGSIERVSVSSDGAQADGRSVAVQISADGRYVAFVSNASNLVNEPPEYLCEENIEVHGSEVCRAIYLRDRETNVTERLPLSGSGGDLDADAYLIAMTPDARYLAFWSSASVLGVEQNPGTKIGLPGVFLFDRETETSEQVDLDSTGSPANEWSSSSASLSDDGRFVTLTTRDDLVPEDTNHQADIYIRDREKMTTERVSVGLSGGQSTGGVSGGAISGDGSTIAFAGRVSDFLEDVPEHYVENIIIQDRENGTNSVLALTESDPRIWNPESLSLSIDGSIVTFIARVPQSGETPPQMLQYDRDSQTLTLISKNSLGVPADHTGSTALAPSSPAVSSDGTLAVFASNATNLVETDANNCRDIFVHDADTGITRRVNVSSDGTEADHEARLPAISALGNAVAFESGARNLVPGDTNGQSDIFVVDLTGNGQLSGGATGQSLSGTPEAPEYCGPPPGDFDCSGEVTPMDALHVLAWFGGVDGFAECISLANLLHCFGGIFISDALLILRYVAGIYDRIGCFAK